MSLEARVTKVEHRIDLLEKAFHENNKILEATHGVVSLILNEQRDKFRDLRQEMNTRFEQQSEQIRQLEFLIRQHFTQS